MTKNNEEDLTVSRIIKAPRSAVWAAWKDPEHLVKWWAPAPFTTVSNKHEFYVGGGFGTTMRTEDGADFYTGESCFLEIVEHERIVWTSALQGGWRPNKDDMPFTAIITLEEHPEGTKYTATALHENAEDRQKHADMGFVDGWGTCIDQLGKLAAQLK
ncbi:MAG: SRPBCC family protein [Proteobacteria bacterium]|nr:SRPBCC family protein [Pseudomonadota bacterium]